MLVSNIDKNRQQLKLKAQEEDAKATEGINGRRKPNPKLYACSVCRATHLHGLNRLLGPCTSNPPIHPSGERPMQQASSLIAAH